MTNPYIYPEVCSTNIQVAPKPVKLTMSSFIVSHGFNEYDKGIFGTRESLLLLEGKRVQVNTLKEGNIEDYCECNHFPTSKTQMLRLSPAV